MNLLRQQFHEKISLEDCTQKPDLQQQQGQVKNTSNSNSWIHNWWQIQFKGTKNDKMDTKKKKIDPTLIKVKVSISLLDSILMSNTKGSNQG